MTAPVRSITSPFEEAARTLGVAPDDDDAAVLKRGYRREVLAHPPDTDPDGFRRIRDAYELLSDPGPRAREMLLRRHPAIDPPRPVASAPTPPGATALAVLRAVAAGLDAAELLLPARADRAPAGGPRGRRST